MYYYWYISELLLLTEVYGLLAVGTTLDNIGLKTIDIRTISVKLGLSTIGIWYDRISSNKRRPPINAAL